MGGGRLAAALARLVALLTPVFLTRGAAVAKITFLGRFSGMGGHVDGGNRQELGSCGKDRRQRRCCEELGHHRAGPFCSDAGTWSG